MSEEDPYGSQLYKTKPELLCPPSMKNITGIDPPLLMCQAFLRLVDCKSKCYMMMRFTKENIT
jgi:hypothetical protein